MSTDHLRWQTPPYLWAIPSGNHPHKRPRKKEALAFYLLALILTCKSIHPAAEAFILYAGVKPISSGV